MARDKISVVRVNFKARFITSGGTFRVQSLRAHDGSNIKGLRVLL